jgi:hypothetical protein
MNTATPPPTSWRDLYKAALFESDPSRLPSRIASAEKALVLRARELFQFPEEHIEEQHALDDAMYALHVLSGRLRHRPLVREIVRYVNNQKSA